MNETKPTERIPIELCSEGGEYVIKLHLGAMPRAEAEAIARRLDALRLLMIDEATL